LKKRQRTPAYIIFYILFLPDTWQILMGTAAAYFLVPVILPEQMALPSRVVLYLMTATIGYAASGFAARRITSILKKTILGDKYHR
jgi:hypothetical protein